MCVENCLLLGYSVMIPFAYMYLGVDQGVYILENTPPPPRWGKKFQLMSFGGKILKSQREKGGKCKRKRKKGRKMRKG
jgi:hypothetical protein